MADITWIKIRVDMFDDEKIKLIENMPEGDQLLIIWIKLLTKAGKLNQSGFIFLAEGLPYNQETLAIAIGKPLQIVRLALDTFEKLRMIEIKENGYITLVNWEKHQNIDGLDKIREQNKLRQQKFREKQKILPENNVNVTLRNETEKKREEKTEKRKEKKIIHPLQKFIKENLSNVSKLRDQLTEKECESLLKKHSKEVIKIVLENMDNHKPLLKKYNSVFKTCNNWCKKESSFNSSNQNNSSDTKKKVWNFTQQKYEYV